MEILCAAAIAAGAVGVDGLRWERDEVTMTRRIDGDEANLKRHCQDSSLADNRCEMNVEWRESE